MPSKNIIKELKDGIGEIYRRSFRAKHMHQRSKSHVDSQTSLPSSSSSSCPSCTLNEQSRWANLPPDLLFDIIQQVESSQISWPARRDIVAAASVCRSWREVTKDVVKTPEQCGRITFPISLKQPGPRESPIQCFIRRDRATSTFRLYLGLSPALSGDLSKMLLSARKIRRTTSTHFVISLAADDFSRDQSSYLGKLKSNFVGTKFNLYDSQPPCGTSTESNNKSRRRSNLKKVSPNMPVGNFKVATISYELNVLRARGPRRMRCIMHSIPISSIHEGGSTPTPMEFIKHFDEPCSSSTVSKGKKPLDEKRSSVPRTSESNCRTSIDPLILKNKAPRWHEQLQCWCLNFRGRVTVASVKNFQLVADIESGENIPSAEQERVILQFGKIGKDIFTMDYCYPLSAFQAFAICLSSFDTKPACE